MEGYQYDMDTPKMCPIMCICDNKNNVKIYKKEEEWFGCNCNIHNVQNQISSTHQMSYT